MAVSGRYTPNYSIFLTKEPMPYRLVPIRKRGMETGQRMVSLDRGVSGGGDPGEEVFSRTVDHDQW